MRAVLLLMLALGLCPVRAHDFWIESSDYRPAVGDEVTLTLRVGVDMGGDSQPNIPDWYSRFEFSRDGVRRPVAGEIGDDPAGRLRIRSPGTYVVGYRSTRDYVKLPPARFLTYLEEEGLEAIAALRAARGQSEAEAREFYSRCAKSLISAQGASTPGFDAQFGFILELIPERDPAALAPGDVLALRLVFRDRPLAGALVQAFTRAQPAEKVTARTGEDGRARLVLPRPGEWLAKAVHMIENTDTEGVEWESYWASLTFRLDPRPRAAD